MPEGHFVLPSAWKEMLGNPNVLRTVDCETATQQLIPGDICGPVEIRIAGFEPVYSEVLFLEMEPAGGACEPLLDYIILEQAQATVDMSTHRLLHVRKVGKAMQNRYHATILNLHQPPGNLEDLLAHDAWKAKEIMYALDRIPRAVWGYEDTARVHLAISGVLLETLSNPDFQSRIYGYVKCGDLLYNLRHPSLDLLATGYYHPVFPLIPPADREEHILRWFGIARHLFDQQHFQGMWPPEMGFCMEMIPLLKKLGFRYVVVDSEQVVPLSPMSWHEIRYRPHIATFEGEEIIVVVRDRDLSNSQEAGMDPGWFIHEMYERTLHCDFPPLVTTASDGDNGGWFRNTRWDSNFWGAFYRPLMRRVQEGTAGFSPAFIHDYLDRFGAEGYVIVRTGAWNTGDHSGVGFVQWTGSAAQKDALERAASVSRDVHELRWKEGEKGWPDPETGRLLEDAMWRLLRAETSCNFFWGEDWVHRAHGDLDQVASLVEEIKKKVKE